MRIGIEGQRLFRRKKHGMDMVALELIKNLQKIDKVNEYVVFVKPDVDTSCIPVSSNFKIVELKGGIYPFWEQIALPLAVKREKCDILHCTSNTGPVFCPVPLIVTLHDIIYLESVSLFKKGSSAYQRLGNMYRRWVVPVVTRKSYKVVTVSEFEKNRIKDFMKLGGNLSSIYNGVSEHFAKITDQSKLSETRKRYNLPNRILFFLGNTDPKKNTPNVLKSFALFNENSTVKYKLVMLDYEENALNSVLSDIGYPELRKDIIMLGYVPNSELPSIINLCELVLYPSLRESFGIPILEGMACGVPVITSNTSSMPEIAGDAAVLINPENPQEIADAISKVLNNSSLKSELSEKGIQRSAMFSWRSMAEKYLKLYLEFEKYTNK
jgi:glycosyltransferase involved in cell wall biosynthesis